MSERGQRRWSLRPLLMYGILVGLPLAGVLGVLYWGERLAAPASVKGQWQVVVTAATAEPDSCAAGFRRALALTIAQSGPNLRLIFNDADRTMLAGRVDGLLVSARSPSGTLTLEGTLDRLRAATRLQGTLTADTCREPLEWSAMRLPNAD